MKLSLEALKERAEAIASEELMESINGGLENACHTVKNFKVDPPARNPLCDNV